MKTGPGPRLRWPIAPGPEACWAFWELVCLRLCSEFDSGAGDADPLARGGRTPPNRGRTLLRRVGTAPLRRHDALFAGLEDDGQAALRAHSRAVHVVGAIADRHGR